MPKLGDVMIGGVVMSILLYASLLIYSDISKTYSSLNPSLINSTTEAVVGNDTAVRMEKKMKGLETALTEVGNFDITILADIANVGIRAVGLILEFPGIILNLIGITIDQLTIIGIPGWFTTLIGMIITVFFILKVFSIITKRGDV